LAILGTGTSAMSPDSSRRWDGARGIAWWLDDPDELETPGLPVPTRGETPCPRRAGCRDVLATGELERGQDQSVTCPAGGEVATIECREGRDRESIARIDRDQHPDDAARSDERGDPGCRLDGVVHRQRTAEQRAPW